MIASMTFTGAAVDAMHGLLTLLYAPLVGSFLGVLIVRLPVGEGVIWGRSACPHCRHRLAVRDLIPLVGWALNRGRCRDCGAVLGWFYPAVELAALALALWAWAVLSGWLIPATALFGWCLLALAWIDQRHQWLPDALSLPLVPAGLIVAWFAVPERWPDHLIGAVAGFLLLYLVDLAYRRLRRRQGLGLGDAKLLAGIGAWVAWQVLASVVLIAALSALCVVLARRLAGRPMTLADKLPFGPHLALGAWLVWLYGPLTV